MIHTITLTPYVEKKVMGTNDDGIYFTLDKTVYGLGGVGLRLSRFLKLHGKESIAHFISGYEMTAFLKEELEQMRIAYHYVESDAKKQIRMCCLEDKIHRLEMDARETQIKDEQFEIFMTLASMKMEKEDICVFEYNETSLSREAMKDGYLHLRNQYVMLICDLHSDYYEMLKEYPASVLLVNEKQYVQYFKKTEKEALSGIIENIKTVLKPMANLVVYTVAYNDFIFFMDGEMIRVVCSVKEYDAYIYKEAIMAGIAKCYEEDGDLQKLSEECLMLSVACAFGYETLSLDELKKELQDKIFIYRI